MGGRPISPERREAAVALLHAGRSVDSIGAALHMDRGVVRRIRDGLGIPALRMTGAHGPVDTVEQAWARGIRATDAGHVEWTGRTGSSGTPIMRADGLTYTVARVAFRMHHGREPEGPVIPACGRPHCVAPGHQQDTRTRTRNRVAMRVVTYGLPAPEVCRGDHDQSVHGRFEADGRAYCRACKTINRHGAEEPAAATA